MLAAPGIIENNNPFLLLGIADIFPSRQMVSDSSAALEYSEREKALIWKQDLRVVPLAAFIYLLCYLDRSNIGKSGFGLRAAKIKQFFDACTLTLQRQCQNFERKYAQ